MQVFYFFINAQEHHPHQWAPLQVADKLNTKKISGLIADSDFLNFEKLCIIQV